MLRRLYICVLLLHPPAFRRHFGDELLSIFDQSARDQKSLPILADGIVSLLRQWTLRPEFWIESSRSQQAASDGVPTFYTLDRFHPKTAALIHGLLLSSILFAATCFAIKYSWIHLLHVRIPEVQFDSPREVLPAATHHDFSEPVAEQMPKQEASIASPARSPSTKKGAATGGVAARDGVHRARPVSKLKGHPERTTESLAEAAIPAALELDSYVGIYVTRPPRRLSITIATQGEQLLMEIDDGPVQALVPVSASKFVTNAAASCWIEFPAKSDGPAPGLRLFHNGQLLTAKRRD